MTVQELSARFPEIPTDLLDEPDLGTFAEAFDDLLRSAQKPSACAEHHDLENTLYLKLIGPMDIYRYGLYSRDRVLTEIRAHLEMLREDPGGFVSRLACDAGDGDSR